MVASKVGIRVGGNTDAMGNSIAGGVALAGASGTLLQRNLIGTDATGTLASPGATGPRVFGASISRITVPTSNASVWENVIISSNTSQPEVVEISGGNNNTFQRNLIGVAADGQTPLGNRPQGISFSNGAGSNTVGGTNPGDGNVIVFAGTAPQVCGGITSLTAISGNIDFSGGSNYISGNSTSGSGGLGIDLGPQGVTRNDAGDADKFQNYPVLSSALFASGTVRVTGTLDSRANTAFRIELFGNDFADPSGYGQGQSYLGFTNVTSDAGGHAVLDVTLPVPASTRAISSTATGPGGTSEFSATLFAKLLNISTRAVVETGDNMAIAGFIITGTDAKKVLLRGIGPSLKVAATPLRDPLLDLFDSSNTLLAENDNWQDSQRTEIVATGIAPTDRKESAVIMSLAPGAYTAQLSDVNGATGIGLIEVYDLTEAGRNWQTSARGVSSA